MLYKSDQLEEQAALQTAAAMCAAARTAPKGHGKDTLHTMVLTGKEKDEFCDKMEALGEREMGDKSWTWYGRDADNVRNANALVLVAADRKPRGVPHCGFCGFGDCGGCRKAGGTCGFAFADLGIALGAAVAAAGIANVDNRIMYSVGKTAEENGYFSDCACLGIPISITGKDIFRDRGITHD
ncbi:MAG: DUF2148 domain-containing protein [Anaerovoracaceae bacterium]